MNRPLRLAALALALLTPLALAQNTEPSSTEPKPTEPKPVPTPERAPESTPPAETPEAEPKATEPDLPPGLDPETAKRIREARQRAAELRENRPSAGAPGAPASGAPSTGPTLTPEMRERLKAAGIDPDSVGRPRTGGATGMPAMPGASGAPGMPGPSMPTMPNMSGMGAAGATGAARPGAGVGADAMSRLSPPGPPPTNSTVPNMAPGARTPEPPEAPPISPDDADAVLEKLMGTWDLAIRLYEQGRPKPATTGRSVFERVAANTFVRETFSGQYGSEAVEGIGYTGYDQASQRFTMAWLDSTTGTIATAKGTYDPDMEMLTFAGLYDGATPPMETRTTITLGQTDRHVFTFKLVQPNGAELTIYEIIYRRAAEASE
ncbi:MAG: DUF1579 family protein [Planctomycetota bacterium]